jgi:hypothetical protein
MKTLRDKKMDSLTKQIKLSNYLKNRPNLVAYCTGLKRLRQQGKTNAEIESVIRQSNLPLQQHLFVMGNFSELMDLKYD